MKEGLYRVVTMMAGLTLVMQPRCSGASRLEEDLTQAGYYIQWISILMLHGVIVAGAIAFYVYRIKVKDQETDVNGLFEEAKFPESTEAPPPHIQLRPVPDPFPRVYAKAKYTKCRWCGDDPPDHVGRECPSALVDPGSGRSFVIHWYAHSSEELEP